MAKDITVTLNGEIVKGRQGMSILELAKECGVEIPTLCYHSELSPIGACRVCVVEIEGAKNLAASCHTPVQEGMAIKTDSPKVIEARRIIVELLLSSHSGDCLFCTKANMCELRKLAADLGVGSSRFRPKKRFYPPEEDCPWIYRDMTKCILCYRCVLACRDLAKKGVLSCGYRGFKNKVISGLDNPLDKDFCRLCEECVRVCPVGAMAKPDRRFRKKIEKPLVIK